MFKAFRRWFDHQNKIAGLEANVASLQDTLKTLSRDHLKLEDYCERCFGRVFKRIERDKEPEPVHDDTRQLQLDTRPTAQQYFQRGR